MPNWLFPIHTTETLEQTLGNATIAANTLVELGPIPIVSSATGTFFYWLGIKVNAFKRIGDIPAVSFYVDFIGNFL
jgi:hypothetical protein